MSGPAFHNVRFPEDYASGTSGGPMYSTRVTVVDSGAEQRVPLWDGGRVTYDIGYTANAADMAMIVSFFRARKGKTYGFRFKDWSDYKAAAEPLGSAGSGRLKKTYTDDAASEVRPIWKPLDGTVVISNAGGPVGFTLDYETGLYVVTSGAGPYFWTGRFDVPMRFDVDRLTFVQEAPNRRSLSSVPLVEVLFGA